MDFNEHGSANQGKRQTRCRSEVRLFVVCSISALIRFGDHGYEIATEPEKQKGLAMC